MLISVKLTRLGLALLDGFITVSADGVHGGTVF
jgi:hypothetical protein